MRLNKINISIIFKTSILAIAMLLLPFVCSAQVDSLKIKQQRIKIVSYTGAAGFFGSLYVLNKAWYSSYPRSSFHLFNDNKEWLQIDKVGHLTTSYHISRSGIRYMKWAGMSEKKAIWYGGLAGPTYLSVIEILDGFSTGWGFSTGDFAANTGGALLAIGQQLAWNEQRMTLKYSYHESQYAKYRPNLLGENTPQRMLKDYNGQTYWLSFNIKSFTKNDKCPSWLNIAIGYGADGMIGAMRNPTEYKGNTMPDFKRTRQYYLSLDADLSKIKTRSRFLNGVLRALNIVKVPFPSLMLEDGKVKAYGLYF